uniref:Uncharacterized protein n=1 Tax=Cacopsylla melanoneura TaxID=428564 RepID=A0A8D8QNI5_9HEMI
MVFSHCTSLSFISSVLHVSLSLFSLPFVSACLFLSIFPLFQYLSLFPSLSSYFFCFATWSVDTYHLLLAFIHSLILISRPHTLVSHSLSLILLWPRKVHKY